MSQTDFFHCADETELLQFGLKLAQIFKHKLDSEPENGLVIYLNGDLGAGKTTLTRSIVRAFGHNGNVKSPTYTLVEEYNLPPYALYHFDLYRLADPEELEFMGIRDYFRAQTVCLLEWASRGEGMIPEADLVIQLDYAEKGRDIRLLPQSELGNAIFAEFCVESTA